MLFNLTGSSCSGKTTLAYAVADRFRGIIMHDFDEIGVPEGADRRWRHRMTEMWVRLALEYQDRGVDLLLTGQSPLGEVLATPSAPLLDGIAVCLVDVSDQVRRARLAERDSGRWDAQAVDAFLGWAAWHREHALDPQYRPHVIVHGSWPEMVWHRWTEWDAGDPRWDLNLHGGYERNNLFELNTVHVPYAHRSANCTVNCGEEGGGGTDDSDWYPIWWAAGQKAVKWSGSSGYRNVFFNNTMTKRLDNDVAGPIVTFYSEPHRIFEFGWDGTAFHHLDVGGTPISDWAHNETNNYSTDITGTSHGVYDTMTDPGQSLFLATVPTP
ncbi:hypothetical protein ABT075_38890 [Streptomyces sp. NPDC002677]|uniref:hypothetical protein n=1 Tax=Streptomyces sp. NPDC002677 TaxID=3154774 RepID=UPI00331F5F7E